MTSMIRMASMVQTAPMVRMTSAIASERSPERSRTEPPQRGEDDGSAIVDWLFKNRPGD